ncbi:hypothetical protein ACWTU9_20340 [Mesorhizobium sp. 128a]
MAHFKTSFAEAFFPRWAEWAASGVLLSLGWMLWFHEMLMATAIAGGYGQGYLLLLEITDQATWSMVLIFFGAVRLCILLINGAWRRSPWGRAGAAFVSCFFWTQIVLSFAPTFGFAFIMACGWLVTDMINVMRAMRDARIVDEAYARGKQGGTIGK